MKICVHSLRFRVGLIIFLAFLMASVTLSAASVYATKIVLDNAADANAQLLDISMHQVDEALGMVENYWVAQLSGSDVITLATIKQKEQYFHVLFTAEHVNTTPFLDVFQPPDAKKRIMSRKDNFSPVKGLFILRY